MANNRMWIENTITGKKVYIAKHYSNGWYTYGDSLMTDAINEFFDAHENEFHQDEWSFKIGYETTKEEDAAIKKECKEKYGILS